MIFAYLYFKLFNFILWVSVAGLAYGALRMLVQGIQMRRNNIGSAIGRRKFLGCSLFLLAIAALTSPLTFPRIKYAIECNHFRTTTEPAMPDTPIRDILISNEVGQSHEISLLHQRSIHHALDGLLSGQLEQFEIATVYTVGKIKNYKRPTEYSIWKLGSEDSSFCATSRMLGGRLPHNWQPPEGKCLQNIPSLNRQSKNELSSAVTSRDEYFKTHHQLLSEGKKIADVAYVTTTVVGPDIRVKKTLTCAKPASMSRDEAENPLKIWVPVQRNPPTNAAQAATNSKTASACNEPEATGDVLTYDVNLSTDSAHRLPQKDAVLDRGSDTAVPIELLVNEPGKKVALRLTSYYPAIWNVRRTEGTNIVAVVANGNHGQAVVGLSRSVPVSATSTESYSRFKECRNRELTNWINKNAISVEKVTLTVASGTIGKPDFDPNNISLEIGSRLLSEFELQTEVLPGRRGLRQLVANDVLRKLTPKEGHYFLSSLKPPPFAGSGDTSDRESSYILLEKTMLPAGLAGGFSVNFYLPSDVPVPDGELGHSSIFRLTQSRAEVLNQLLPSIN